MNPKPVDIVNVEQFNARFMDTNWDQFGFRTGVIQVYPLSIAPLTILTPSPLFRTDYNFLLLIEQGGGQQQINTDTFELKANDVLFIREGHLNAIKSIEKDTTGYFIYIDSTLLPQLFIDNTLLHRLTFHPKQSLTKPAMEWICSCCELLSSQVKDDPYADQIQLGLLRTIILKLAGATNAPQSKPNRQTEITMLFKELLYENFLTCRDVTFYATSLSVSTNYLNRCVNQVTNKTPKQHISEMVIMHSKVLLQSQAQDVSQIAFALNFSAPSYFGRLFKQLTGKTPTEYKKTFMQDLSEYWQDS
ncbi:AraC family transcriptional regulator [Spirosoma sordidisoli]|uniref:AraC family transcriptional regulator n=1 Tax=Spirosoma sordidisoli TaxID=2502893 RepID=A0A4Q2UGU6_9BACT|nr:helix-turn-helix transcriptional regulator [Spirosoma sordidisoli]RYC66655.1 AraC family transcriptional regulator [Spirosoma sordidisoli]